MRFYCKPQTHTDIHRHRRQAGIKHFQIYVCVRLRGSAAKKTKADQYNKKLFHSGDAIRKKKGEI